MVDKPDRDETLVLAAGDPLFEAVLDVRIAAMHRLLDQMAAINAVAALRALRESFPETPFEERLRALTRSRH